MKKLITAMLSCIVITSGPAISTETAEWSYAGQTGPEHWSELDESYEACAAGKHQSPIDLTKFTEAQLTPIKCVYDSPATEILNNGHTIQANIAPGCKLVFEDKEFDLKQFHFHAPSEHHIEGKTFAMEAHFVHAAEDGSLAVIAVMFEEGAENQTLAKLWKEMPAHMGEKSRFRNNMNAKDLLPESKDYYRIDGSLTTPPCSEGVNWLVMKQSLTASKDQIENFMRVMGHANARPIQPINARAVLK